MSIMALAKHLQIARTQGAEAGMEAYMSAPSSKLHAAYKTISKKRTPETKLAAYCQLFAKQLDGITPRLPVQQEAVSDVNQVIAEAVAQAVAAALGNAGVGEAVTEEAVVEQDFITAGQAWETLIALGDDPDFPAPKDPNRAAGNGQLYRLNTVHGVLRIDTSDE